MQQAASMVDNWASTPGTSEAVLGWADSPCPLSHIVWIPRIMVYMNLLWKMNLLPVTTLEYSGMSNWQERMQEMSNAMSFPAKNLSYTLICAGEDAFLCTKGPTLQNPGHPLQNWHQVTWTLLFPPQLNEKRSLFIQLVKNTII